MKKIFLLSVLLSAFLLCGCTQPAPRLAEQPASPAPESQKIIQEPEKADPPEADAPTERLLIEANGTTFYAVLENNSSAQALKEKLTNDPLTVSMQDYGGFEKVGALPWKLPQNDIQIHTEPGDVILYQGDKITVYYGQNDWSFTRLGKIENVSAEDLLAAFGDGAVSMTFSLE